MTETTLDTLIADIQLHLSDSEDSTLRKVLCTAYEPMEEDKDFNNYMCYATEDTDEFFARVSLYLAAIKFFKEKEHAYSFSIDDKIMALHLAGTDSFTLDFTREANAFILSALIEKPEECDAAAFCKCIDMYNPHCDSPVSYDNSHYRISHCFFNGSLCALVEVFQLCLNSNDFERFLPYSMRFIQDGKDSFIAHLSSSDILLSGS